MITIEKIKIYNKFGGDIDGFYRGGKTSEENLFDDNDWSLIDEFEQDVKLISERLASKEYGEKALGKISKKCDIKTVEYFTFKIPFYADFQEISKIIGNIKSRINIETDTLWTGFDNTEILKNELDSDQKRIELLDFEILEKIMVEFLPTSTYQELAMSNGWSEEYLKIAENSNIYTMKKRFLDEILSNLKKLKEKL